MQSGREDCQSPASNPFPAGLCGPAVPAEFGVPTLDLCQSHPTHVHLYVSPRVLKETGRKEVCPRMNFPSPGGIRVAEHEWAPRGEQWYLWEPGKQGPDPSAASTSCLEPLRPQVHGSYTVLQPLLQHRATRTAQVGGNEDPDSGKRGQPEGEGRSREHSARRWRASENGPGLLLPNPGSWGTGR